MDEAEFRRKAYELVERELRDLYESSLVQIARKVYVVHGYNGALPEGRGDTLLEAVDSLRPATPKPESEEP